MKKNILITGANGMLAKQLAMQLESEYSIRYLTRKVTQENEYLWDLTANYIDPNALKNIDTVIHLAGSSVAEKKWSEKRKKDIISSRVDSAQLILDELNNNNLSIESFISASAIGYYGTTTTDTIYNEENKKGHDFLSDVCHQWEDAAHQFKSSKVANRVAVVRIGIIFSKSGGALKKIVNPIKYGVGSGLGSGKQYMPWIHIQDLCSIFHFIVQNKNISGVFNAVSPEHVTNTELTRKIGKVINRPIILPNIPNFVLRAIFGEMSLILLNGSRVSSEKIIKQGFNFEYGNIDNALNNLLQNKN